MTTQIPVSQAKKSQNQLTGEFGESVVADFLLARDTRILDRNWRIKEGEIDLVALLPNGSIAFVEVKTRRSYAYGHPLEAISYDKALRLQRLALAWLATHNCLGRHYQIDCVAVLIENDGKHTIEYRANVL
ncbi:MAG: YraN family protein [Streptomycetaceae bacterium]|nr:MAG: YraN family protein [Streptomycetaceae bacterium]